MLTREMDLEKKKYLELQAREIRKNVIKMIAEAGQGHIGGCLSIADLVSVLYFEVMNIDPKNPKMEGRDRVVLSKGHAGPCLYAALAMKGFFPKSELMTLNKPNTNLPSHCDMTKTPGIDMTAGSLGQGISCAVGVAKAAKISGGKEYIYAVIGDGESQEGTVWEASMAAAHYKLDNLIVFMDANNFQIDGSTDEVMSLGDPLEKWSAFGFKTFECDGHDVEAILNVISLAKKDKSGKPIFILMHTVKGKGVSFIEAEGAANHSMSLTAEQVAAACLEIDGEVA